MNIPTDPRYPNDPRPLITNEMKAECIGEFEIPLPVMCNECEGTGCDDCDDGERILNVNVPWTMMKDIYKKMALIAAKHEAA
jgi:hypothetical protein